VHLNKQLNCNSDLKLAVLHLLFSHYSYVKYEQYSVKYDTIMDIITSLCIFVWIWDNFLIVGKCFYGGKTEWWRQKAYSNTLHTNTAKFICFFV